MGTTLSGEGGLEGRAFDGIENGPFKKWERKETLAHGFVQMARKRNPGRCDSAPKR
jgi:hypothetical protein